MSRKPVSKLHMMILILAEAALIILGVIIFIPAGKKSSNQSVVQEGVDYVLQSQGKDESYIDASMKKADLSAETEGMNTWEKLNYYDTYIMGDSRTEPFFWSGLQVEHVYADKSTTIKYIGEHMEDIEQAKPGNLVLSFGMNDMGMYAYDPEHYWENGDDYVEEYAMYIDQIHEVSPDTNVYINSIIPVLDVALESQPRWAAVDEWNAALKAYCEANDVGWIDTTFITSEYGDLFDDDGVHFYSQTVLDAWGDAILEAVEERMVR